MKRMPIISFVSLLMFAAAPCSAQKAQAPLSAMAAQSKEQNQRLQFTHAELVEFIHAVQTEAANWKDTINSVDPSAFHSTIKPSIEKEKKALLLALDEIERLSPSTSEKNAATDLLAEFVVHTLLDSIVCGAESLGLVGPSYNSIESVAKTGELLQVQREVQKADSALFKEILNRIANMARSEKAGGCE